MTFKFIMTMETNMNKSTAIRTKDISTPTLGVCDPSLQELVKRAEALQPLLRKNAVESDQNRRASEENILAMAQAGIFKLMVPKRYGGFEGTLRSHLEMSAALAEA